jgi:hypothetical protein
MDLNLFEAAVVIAIAWMVWNVMKGGRWNRETRRWERHSPDNPYVRAGTAIGEDLRARKEIEDLRRRVATLERLATDPTTRLDAEIAQLRDTPERRPEA